MLTHPRCNGKTTTAQARDWLRNRLRARGVTDAAGVLREALQELLDKKVIEAMDPENTTAEQRGRKVGAFQKKTWTEIAADETAKTTVRNLGVGEDHFAE